MKNFWSLLLLSLLAYGCTDLNKAQYLKKLTQLDSRLLHIEEKLKDSRMQTISSIKVNSMQTELRIKQNLYLDTINVDLAKQLDAFKVMRKSIKPLMQQYLKLRNGIKEERQVLRTLKRDISEGRGARNRYAEYIRFERAKIKQLTLLLADYVITKAKFFEDYERLYPPIEAFSQQLLKKKQ